MIFFLLYIVSFLYLITCIHLKVGPVVVETRGYSTEVVIIFM